MFEKIKNSGWIGGFAANVLTFLTANWALAMSTLFAIAVVAWGWALDLVQQEYIYVPFGVFLAFLWTYIGLAVLKTMNVVKTVRVQHEYEYSFAVEGSISASFTKFESNHPTRANEDGVNIAVHLRNVGSSPAKLKVEELRVVLDERSTKDPPPVEQTFARFQIKGIRALTLPRDTSKERLSGTMTAKFIYGPPDDDVYLRRYSFKADIDVFINKQMNVIVNVDSRIAEEKDEPIL